MWKNILLPALALLWIPQYSYAASPEVYSPLFGGAIRGYDPVAYFTLGRPEKGRDEHRVEYRGADWYFTTEDHRRTFLQDPEKYAPRYGGYCTYAVSRVYLASTDPQAWSIVDDRLYLNYSLAVRDEWQKDVPGNIRRADANWPGVLQ